MGEYRYMEVKRVKKKGKKKEEKKEERREQGYLSTHLGLGFKGMTDVYICG